MALAEMLRTTHSIRKEVKVVDGKVQKVEDKVEDVGDKVDEVGEKVGDKVQCVDEKVQVLIDGTRGLPSPFRTILTLTFSDGNQARLAAKETKLIIQQTADGVDEIKCSCLPTNLAFACCLRSNLLIGDQYKQFLKTWLSPADPSTNHNIAQKVQQEGTAVWLFEGSIVIEWKFSGSLLWIHGKRAFGIISGSRLLTDSDYLSGLGEKRNLVRFSSSPSYRGLFFVSSSIIQDIMAVCDSGPAIMAYFYFDFRDLRKQSCHDLLRSLVFQLSTDSSPCCGILHRVYKAHKDGTQQPSDDTLRGCLKQMLTLLAQGPTFIVLDALDECPDSFTFPSPRDEVLQLVKELVNLHLPGLHICATSRPEVYIRAVLEPLAFRSVSLHDESGQKADIADYVRSVVKLSPSSAMRRWRAEDKNMVIETLTERADGM